MILTPSYLLPSMLLGKDIDFENDDLIIVLMDGSFVFDPSTMEYRTDVSADIYPSVYGHIPTSLTPGVITVTGDTASIAFSDVSWTAAGGDIGPVAAAMIYLNSGSYPIVGCMEWNSAYTIPQGSTIKIEDIEFELEGPVS
jgi:hypothetical protein